MVKIEMIFNYLAHFFSNASIMGAFTLMFHVGKPIAVGTLMKMDALISGMVLEAPLALFVPYFFIIPYISEGIEGTSMHLLSLSSSKQELRGS